MNRDYVSIINEHYPHLQIECFGDPGVYENLTCLPPDTLPSKEDLDAIVDDLVTAVNNRFKERLALLNNDYERAVAYLKSTYPSSEVSTWAIQITEARAIFKWLEDNPTLTIDDMPATVAPFLVTLSASRLALGYPNDLAHLAQRVIENDSLFTPALSQVTAIRHATERQMLLAVAAEDMETLDAVTWTFPWPPVLIE